MLLKGLYINLFSSLTLNSCFKLHEQFNGFRKEIEFMQEI